jgi:hypothetical protein
MRERQWVKDTAYWFMWQTNGPLFKFTRPSVFSSECRVWLIIPPGVIFLCRLFCVPAKAKFSKVFIHALRVPVPVQGQQLTPLPKHRWSDLPNKALMMEAARTSETLVNFYQTTRCYNPEDSNLLFYLSLFHAVSSIHSCVKQLFIHIITEIFALFLCVKNFNEHFLINCNTAVQLSHHLKKILFICHTWVSGAANLEKNVQLIFT